MVTKPKYFKNMIRFGRLVWVEVRIKATPLPHKNEWEFKITSLKSYHPLPDSITERVGKKYASREELKQHFEELLYQAIPFVDRALTRRCFGIPFDQP